MLKKTLGPAIAVLVILALPALSMGGLGNIVIDRHKASKAKVPGIGPVDFPHTKHEKRYKCSACHPKIFKKKRGANDINMQKNISGKFCGSPNCHNSPKAFPLYECNRCHRKK